MVEGGHAEKFPDEWDLQFLGNTIISQLSSGIPSDFLIRRYVFSTLFYYNDSILLLKFQISFIYKVFVNFLSEFFFLTSPGKLFWKQNLGPPWNSPTPVAAPLLMVPTLGPLTLTVPLSEEDNLPSSLCKFNFSHWIFLTIFISIIIFFFRSYFLYLKLFFFFCLIQILSELSLLPDIWKASLQNSYH